MLCMTSAADIVSVHADETYALQELNVKLTKIGRQLQAYHADLQEIKAALQQHKLQTPI